MSDGAEVLVDDLLTLPDVIGLCGHNDLVDSLFRLFVIAQDVCTMGFRLDVFYRVTDKLRHLVVVAMLPCG